MGSSALPALKSAKVLCNILSISPVLLALTLLLATMCTYP